MLVAVLFGGCSGNLTRHGPVDPALAVYIPPDTVALAGVRVDRLRETPLYRKLDARKKLPPLDDIHIQDVQSILLASDAKNVLAVLRGSFGANPSGVTLVDSHTALAGPPAMVQAAILQAKSGRQPAPHELVARASAIPAGSQIWAVAEGWPGLDPETLRYMGNAANVDRILRSVKGATLAIDLSNGIHAVFTGDCQTEAAAGSLADSLRGLTALARVGLTHNQPALARVFDGIQIRQDARVVRLDVDVSQDLADKLADRIPAGR